MSFILWLVALAVGGVMVGTGMVMHPALTIGGAFIVAIALAKALQEVWAGPHSEG